MNEKILNVSLSIIVVLIVIIFSSIFYVVTCNKATDSIYDDIVSEKETSSNEIAEVSKESQVVQVVGFEHEKIQKIYPFTGAFPGIDIIPFLYENGNLSNFSNEQILRLGFAKVTKEDWADTYISEVDSVSIPASLLDGYIKDIFGKDVNYEKANFSNTKYTVDKDFKSHTSSYEAEYIPETDTYKIDHIAGDGIDENYVYILEPSASKIQEKFEIEIPYVYVVYGDTMATTEKDGEQITGFEYIIYAKYNFETKTFSEELGRFNDFDEIANNNGEIIISKAIEQIAKKSLSKLSKLHLIYETSEDGTEMILKQINK